MVAQISDKYLQRWSVLFRVFGWFASLSIACLLSVMIVYQPDGAGVIVKAVAAALCGLVLLHIRLTWFTSVFIFLICFTAWVPLSVNISGLNLRASQILLPLVFVRLWVHDPSVLFSRSAFRLVSWWALLWGTFLFWTIVNIDSYGSALKPIAHVFLLGLNVLHMVTVYLLVIRTPRLYEVLTSLLLSVTVLNGFLLTVTVGSALGFSVLQRFVAQVHEAALVEGNLTAGFVSRFTFSGINSGVVSAAAVIIGLCLLFDRKPERSRWLWVHICMAGMGVVLGFSRQSFVSLVVGLIVVGLYLILRVQISQVLKTAVVALLVLAFVVWGVAQLPGGQSFVQAFAGRVFLLFQSESYSTGTIVTRTMMWSGMWQDITQNPFWGNGQDSYMKYVNPGEEGSHNFPLEVLHATGLSGFIPYTFFHINMLFLACQFFVRKRIQDTSIWMLLGLFGAYVVMWLASTTNLIFWNPAYWMAIGLLIASIQLARERLEDALRGGRSRAPQV